MKSDVPSDAMYTGSARPVRTINGFCWISPASVGAPGDELTLPEHAQRRMQSTGKLNSATEQTCLTASGTTGIGASPGLVFASIQFLRREAFRTPPGDDTNQHRRAPYPALLPMDWQAPTRPFDSRSPARRCAARARLRQ